MANMHKYNGSYSESQLLSNGNYMYIHVHVHVYTYIHVCMYMYIRTCTVRTHVYTCRMHEIISGPLLGELYVRVHVRTFHKGH